MEPLTGALVAVAVAWASIAAAILLPVDRWVSARALRAVGGATLVVLGLGILGVPYASKGAVALLIGGIAAGVLVQRRSRRRGARPTLEEGGSAPRGRR